MRSGSRKDSKEAEEECWRNVGEQEAGGSSGGARGRPGQGCMATVKILPRGQRMPLNCLMPEGDMVAFLFSKNRTLL